MVPDTLGRTGPTQSLGFDVPFEPAFDRLARLTTRVLHTTTALVINVEADRQDVLGCAGPAEGLAFIHQSQLLPLFCHQVVAEATPLIIDDTRAVSSLQQPLLIAEPNVIAYLGLPLITNDGVTQGVFCVVDTVPRQWTEEELATMRELTELVEEELNRQATARIHAEDALELRTTKAMLALVDRQLPLVFWTTDTELHITSVSGSGIPDLPSDPTPFLGQTVSAYLATTGASSAMIHASQNAYHQALAGHMGAYQRELGGYTSSIQIEPLRDDTGQIIGCLGVNLPLRQVQASHDRLQTLSIQLLHAQEAERRMIARELHDQIGQELTIIQMSLQELLDSDPMHLPTHVEAIITTVEQVLAQVRDMALDLRPAQLDDLGLDEALRWYLERHAALGHLTMSFDVPPLIPRPRPEVEATCFRIAQEAMTNILRSAHATHVWVTIAYDAEKLTLTVRDDGRGFDVAAARAQAIHGASLGLLSMEERAALIGGHATIESALGHGTTVRAWLPLRASGAVGDG